MNEWLQITCTRIFKNYKLLGHVYLIIKNDLYMYFKTWFIFFILGLDKEIVEE